jgi:hypothetical protein
VGGLIGDELRAESVDEIVVGCEPRLCGIGVNNACYNFDWRRGVGGGMERSSQGIWRPTVMVCAKDNIRICSAVLCDCVVGRGQGDRSAGADDVVVGNREDAEVCESNKSHGNRSHMRRPCASLLRASHSRRGSSDAAADVIMRHRDRF